MFFFKQKTAYEMRISDWSSDVCASDLCLAAVSRCRCAIGAGLGLSGRAGGPASGPVCGGQPPRPRRPTARRLVERKSVVEGTSVAVRVDLVGRRRFKKKLTNTRQQILSQ